MLARFALGLAALAAQASAISTIQAKGSKFFTSDGNQFYIKGIAYQLTPNDPLVDNNQCQLDANLMKSLGANAIRVYHVDPSQNHDACMSTFADAGIYLFVDLDTFSTYILPATPEWNQTMHDAYAAVMDVFQQYDNVAGFFVGNEVLTKGADSIAAPYVKAAAADMKAYRDSKGYRNVPVGYSAADIPDLRPNLQNYLACGNDPAAALDFYSLNAYEWCGASSTYESSGYSQLQANASNYNIPIFFSETGCIVPSPRYFDDQSAILGPEMDDTWSGAIIYEWIEEQNNYGLISYGPPAPTGASNPNVVDGYTRQGTPTPVQPDFSNLSNQWKTLSPTGVQMAAYNPSLTAPACPSYTEGLWMVSGDVPLPTMGQAYDSNGSNPSASPTSSTGTSPVASSPSTILSSASTPIGSSSSAPPAAAASDSSIAALGASGTTSMGTVSSSIISSRTTSLRVSSSSSTDDSNKGSGSSGDSGSNAASPSPSSGGAARALALGGDSNAPGGRFTWCIASLMTGYVLFVAFL